MITLTENNELVFLSGGTGTPKLLLGFQQLVNDSELTIIGNTGDDDFFFDLLVSPDIDTLLYLFSRLLDLEKFWGIKDDTFHTLKMLELLGEDTWFGLGDRDLGIHIHRTKLLNEGYNLTEIVSQLCKQLNISARIFPMSNDPVRTIMYTDDGKKLSFQEYTVKNKEQDIISRVDYAGSIEASTTQEVISAIINAKLIIIGPSNPITSIGPILSINEIREALVNTSAKKIAISPLSSGKAFSGPAARLLAQLGLQASSVGIAELYRDFLDYFVICESDKKDEDIIRGLGIEPICMNISLKTDKERIEMAQKIFEYL